MKLGLIYTAYNTREYITRSLQPWIDFRWSKKLRADFLDHEVVICAVNVAFVGFENGPEDGTRALLEDYREHGDIDYLITGPDNILEITARGMALRYLIDKECDTIIQWDSDEIPMENQINGIIGFVQANPFVAWFRLSYRNAYQTPDQYIAEPFTPPRIHRVQVDGYRVHSFSADNDIQYGGTITRDIKHQSHFPSLTIPASVAHIKHLTWLSDSRSRAKERYQRTRWGVCSFKWSEERQTIEFDSEYYAARGESLPKVLRDPSV